MEMTFKKLIINLFTTLFISGVALSFLLATERPYTLNRAEKYMLFESCEPYYDMTNIPKTLDELTNINTYKPIKVNTKSLSYYEKILYRSVVRTDLNEKNIKSSNADILWFHNMSAFDYGYYKNGKLIMFQIYPQENDNQSIYCKYNSKGKLAEITYDNGNGYIDYDYKGNILKVKSHSGFGGNEEY